MLTSLQELYTNYDETVVAIRKKARMFDGFFGLGKDPKKDPCHEAFYTAVGTWMEQFVASAPAQEDVLQAGMFLVEEPVRFYSKECYWFMFAAQGHMKALIPLMDKTTCKTIHDRISGLYKKYERMPLQNDLLKLLKKAAK